MPDSLPIDCGCFAPKRADIGGEAVHWSISRDWLEFTPNFICARSCDFGRFVKGTASYSFVFIHFSVKNKKDVFSMKKALATLL